MPTGIYKRTKLSGMSSKKHSENTKEKMKQSRLKRKKQLGYLNSSKTREKIREALIGRKLSKEHKKKISEIHKRRGVGKWMKGRKLSEETRKKMSEAKKEEKAYQWKGKRVGYRGLHKWVNKWKGKPKICEHCGATYKEREIQWANIDHKYRRNLNDFISLCVPCHRKYDAKEQTKTTKKEKKEHSERIRFFGHF